MEIDRQLRKDIAAEVAVAVRETLARMEEKWLTADELCKHFGMISKAEGIRRHAAEGKVHSGDDGRSEAQDTVGVSLARD